MKITKIALCIPVVALLFVCSVTFAEIPRIINYQGKLTDTDGKPVSDGAYSVTFRIYDQEAGGSPLWYETQFLATQKGIFSTQIGATKDLNLPFDKPYYLGIKVGTDAEMTPRQPFSSFGYAFRAEVADKIKDYDILPYDDAKVGTSAAKYKITTLNEEGQIPTTAIPKMSPVFAFSEFAGDGSDGDVVISSSTDISGQTKQYNNLTINPGVTLTAKNCYIAVKETLIVNGSISADAGGFWGGGWHYDATTGGIYGDKGYGFNDNSETNAMVSMRLFQELCAGGDGGDGDSYGGRRGKVGGLAGGDPVPQYKKDRLKYTPYLICFGWGGGGGGGYITNASGGAGGGFLYIEANNIIINSDGKISANGDNFGERTAGGGGGGTVYLMYRTIKNDGIIEVNGGRGSQDGRAGTALLRKI